MKTIKRYLTWQVVFGVSLLVLSAVIYFIHFLLFRDTVFIFKEMINDLAFIPIEVLIVTLIINQLLEQRERAGLLNKLNMVIGAFFSEIGNDMLIKLSSFDPCAGKIASDLAVKPDWTDKEFKDVGNMISGYSCEVRMSVDNLVSLQELFRKNRPYLLRMLENPNLLEHDRFTELLWAVFHLSEELHQRQNVRELPKSDIEHLSVDIKRAYALLITEWLFYMKHLKENYPFLFSLAIRMNPFDSRASVIVKK